MRSVGVSASTSERKASSCACVLRSSRSRAMACSTAPSSTSVATGLVRKSCAPAFMARTLDGMSPCPERNTTGSACRISASRCWSCNPLSPGMRRSSRMQPGDSTSAVSQELPRRFVLRDPISDGLQQSRHRLAPGRIVVNHVHDARGGCHVRCAEANGNVKRNTAPPLGAFSARISPPCASTIVRDIASPRPMPVDLDVTKARRCEGAGPRAMPPPESVTDTSAYLVICTPAPNRQHPSFRRRALHGFHGIECEVDDHLLKLNAIRADLRQSGLELRLDRHLLVQRFAGHSLHRLVDGLVEIRFPQFELGLAQKLANSRNDVAGALIFALDVAQDLGHLAQLGRIGVDQYFCRACIVVDGAERLIELVGNRCGHLAQGHAPVHVRHFRKALPRLRLGDAAPAALREHRRDQQALSDDDCQRCEDLPPMFTPERVVGKPDFTSIRQAPLVQRPALQRTGIGHAPAGRRDQSSVRCG